MLAAAGGGGPGVTLRGTAQVPVNLSRLETQACSPPLLQAPQHIVLLLRLLFTACPVALGANLVPVLSPAQDTWHALGRLMLIARGFTLLVGPVCFELTPGVNAVAQAAAVAVSMWRARAACSVGYLHLPAARSSLAG